MSLPLPKIEWTDCYDICIPGDYQETIEACAVYIIEQINKSIKTEGQCSLVLSGGSTPKAIYTLLATPFYARQVDWSKVVVFWGDERAVPFDDSESNYNMVKQTGLLDLLPKGNIHRMVAESDIDNNARDYEKILMKYNSKGVFDLLMLGVGEDGHTASLFPNTLALNAPSTQQVVSNYVAQKDVWRMTLTYSAINSARQILIFALGKTKQGIMEKLFNRQRDPATWPVQNVGVFPHQVLWFLDQDAAETIIPKLKK